MNRRDFIKIGTASSIGLAVVKPELIYAYGKNIINILFNSQGSYNKKDEKIKFNNDASDVGFIGKYNSVEELIAADTRELERIGGSFEEIADRIKEFLEYAKNEAYGRPNKNSINPIIITFYGLTRGIQECPFEGCNEGWNDIGGIENSETKEKLTINEGVEHLTRVHHLLEKGNEYEIIPEKFYKHFMPLNIRERLKKKLK